MVNTALFQSNTLFQRIFQFSPQVFSSGVVSCHRLLFEGRISGQEIRSSVELKQQWASLDRNHDGFLDVNEVRGDAGPRDNTSRNDRQQGNRRHEGNRQEQRKGPPDRQGGPQPRESERAGKGGPQDGQGGGYSIEQVVSDRAQLTTIAFAALAYLTGDLCGDTFLPPGKVSDSLASRLSPLLSQDVPCI